MVGRRDQPPAWRNANDPPARAAAGTEAINSVAPVPAAKDVLRARAEKETSKEDRDALLQVVNSPLVFPTPDMDANLHYYKQLTEDEEKEWNDLFQVVVQG